MNRDRRSSSNDPTDEQTAAQSTQSASGLTAGREGPGVGRYKDYLDREAVNRSEGSYTPRRYEQPIEDDENPVMPEDDSTVNSTK